MSHSSIANFVDCKNVAFGASLVHR